MATPVKSGYFTAVKLKLS